MLRLFPNAEALDLQLQGVGERPEKTYDFIEPTGIEIYGIPNEAIVEKMESIAGSGIPVSLRPQYVGGFLRVFDG